MNTKNNKLKKLPVNKTVVFNSPIEGDDVLTRTGTITEGSSFFHALLHSYSNEYTSMDKNDRMNFVRKLRASMIGKVDIDSWEEIGGGFIAKIPFQELLSNVLYNFNLFLNEREEKVSGRATRKAIKLLVNEDKDIEVYNLLLDIVPVKEIEKNILSKAYENSEGKSIKKTISNIVDKGLSYIKSLPELNAIEVSKKDYLSNIFGIFLKVICNEAHKQSYKNYVKGLENMKEEVDSYTIDFISNRFDRDIYFINGNNRLPYNNYLSEIKLRKKSIIVILIDKNHYEIVGRLLPGNKIQREFDCNDILIKKINMFLLNPERIPSNYPELKEYLPDYESPIKNFLEEQEQDSDDQDSEKKSDISEEESDNYYDSSDNESSCKSNNE